MTEDEFRNRLEGEVAHWQQERLINETQAAAILARYGLAEGEQRRGRLAVVLGFLGASLVGIGVIVFFAANWQYVPGWTKLLLIFAAVALSSHLGYWLRYERPTYQGTGNALLFLGALLFGAAIFLIAQGFHVNANEPVLLLLWAVGVLPMAYLLGSRAMVVLMGINLAIALGWEAGFWLEGVWLPFPYFAIFLVYGVLLYTLGRLHGAFEQTKPYELPYALLGMLLILGALFPLTFGFLHDGTIQASAPPVPGGAVARFVVLLVGAGAVTLANLLLRRRPSPTTFPELAALVVLLVLGGFLFFLEGGMGTPMAILFNLLLFALIVGAIAVGHWNREPAWVNVGTLFFALLVIVRYFDWCWELLPRSLFFVSAGLLLLFGGMALERTRRHVLERWDRSEATPGGS
jgi:uncharacterized membrane protein